MKSAAQVMVGFVHLDPACDVGIIHLVHPNPIPWSVLDKGLSSALGLPTIPFDHWIDRLGGLERQIFPDGNGPSRELLAQVISLLPFFEHAKALWREQTESRGEAIYDMTKARKLSPLLCESKILQLSDTDIQDWITGWKRIGFLPK